jgi:hypothetical protein
MAGLPRDQAYEQVSHDVTRILEAWRQGSRTAHFACATELS